MLQPHLWQSIGSRIALAGWALAIGLASGCTSLESMRGEGFSSAENWGEELRESQRGSARPGGVSTKAQQVERNLGVK